MDVDVRWRQRLENFSKAAGQLREFLDKPGLNKFERQGLVQCFEYTFELAWKTMKDYLEAQGFTVKSPRETVQAAFQCQLVADGHAWIDALDKRNLLAHTYDEARADEAEGLIRGAYGAAIFALLERLESEG